MTEKRTPEPLSPEFLEDLGTALAEAGRRITGLANAVVMSMQPTVRAYIDVLDKATRSGVQTGAQDD